jgi:hypothetical protein
MELYFEALAHLFWSQLVTMHKDASLRNFSSPILLEIPEILEEVLPL